MADTLWTHDFSANFPRVKAQGIKTMWELSNYMVWGRWMKAYTTKGKRAVNPNGVLTAAHAVRNSPFVMHRELGKEGGDNLRVPIYRKLKELGKKGEEQLFNRTEERKINYAKVFINQLRHGEKVKKGNMSEQIMKKEGIPETSRMGLGMQLAERYNFLEIPYAFYKRFNFSVLTDTDMFGDDTNVAACSHPHFYTVGASKVSYSGGYPGSSGYEASVAAAIDAIGATHVLSGSFLKALNSQYQIRKIPHLFAKGGVKYRGLLVDPYGMAALRNDVDIKAVNRAGFVDSMILKNPELTGMELFYEGWAIFDGGNAIYPLQTLSSEPLYGPCSAQDTFTNLDDFQDYSAYTKFGAIVLGDNAIAQATGWDLKWTGEKWDHDAIREIGYSIGLGFARNDYQNLDDGSTGQYLVNDTSAIIGYYAAVPTL